MRRDVLFLALLLGLSSCGRVKRGAKDALNTGGELAGEAASEVAEGVKTGAERPWAVDVRLSAERQQQGLAMGKVAVENGGTSSGNDNLLVVYLTNKAAIDDTLQVMAFDKDSLEMGRARVPIKSLANGGAYYEVRFPDRTDLERKSRIIIE